MTYRIRHCVACPHCLTRYLIGRSPYANGSYVEGGRSGAIDEYLLYCSCQRFPVPIRWSEGEVRACIVSNSAQERGYGSREEILMADQQDEAPDLYARINMNGLRRNAKGF